MTVQRDTSTTNDVSTDAQFRAWASAIHNALSAVGLVNTSDTGQINLATVTNPGANTSGGYEIWRFNDANQSNDPIYFKIEYGCGTTTSRPSLRWTFGTGSNGSGTISNASSQIIVNSGISSPTNPELHVCHVDGALIVFDDTATASATGSTCMTMVLERFRDANGAVITSGGDMGFGYLNFGPTAVGNGQRKGGSWTESNAVQQLGVGSGADHEGKKKMGPTLIGNNHPFITFLFIPSTEVAAGDSGSVSVYGTSRTYKAFAKTGTLPTHAIANSLMNVGTALNLRLLLLNE